MRLQCKSITSACEAYLGNMGLYALVAAKRGARLKWREADGEALSFSRYIGHCKRPDTICWIEMAIAEAEEMQANQSKGRADVLKLVPQDALIAKDDLIETCRQNSIGRNRAMALVNKMIEDKVLFEHCLNRAGKRAKVCLARVAKAEGVELNADDFITTSRGYYIIGVVKEAVTDSTTTPKVTPNE